MKRYCYIVIIFMLLCSCEKDATEIVLQEVKGARDCVDGSEGSWSDGVVTLDWQKLRFVVKSSGILKFDHRKITTTVHTLKIHVESQLLKRVLISTKSNYAWKECNVGLVDTGDIISIYSESGIACKVKNVRIVCQDCMVDDF